MIYESKVISGKGRGRQMGFPTFNLIIPKELTQRFGVYAARVEINGKKYPAALHFGPIPTFNTTEPSLEIFVLDYQDDQLVEEISFELVAYLREIRQFSAVEKLKSQIAKDVENINNIVKV